MTSSTAPGAVFILFHFFCFFRFLVCFNRSFHVHPILRHRLHLAFLSLQSRGHWNPIPFVIYTGIESSRSLPSFGISSIKDRTWQAQCLWRCYSDIELFVPLSQQLLSLLRTALKLKIKAMSNLFLLVVFFFQYFINSRKNSIIRRLNNSIILHGKSLFR